MSPTPNLNNRRTRAEIKPAPDQHVDPIETPAPKKVEAAVPPPKRASDDAETAPRALNLQVNVNVAQTIDFVKFKTKLSKRAIVEQAVLAHWSDYTPEQD